MNLKLAEYNLETGKFERFLELGKDFLFGGDFVYFESPSEINEDEIYCEHCNCKSLSQLLSDVDANTENLVSPLRFHRDQKDPLNRFNGLFDGRTYGDGHFVLIENDQDNILETYQSCNQTGTFDHISEIRIGKRKVGNLHENPELWEKAR